MKLIAFLSALIWLSCSSGKSTSGQEGYQQLAARKYGEGVTYLFNASKSYVLCVRDVPGDKPALINTLSFFVYDLKEDKLVFEDSQANTSVVWENDSKFKVTMTAGIVPKTGMVAFGYRYDVRSGQKLPMTTGMEHTQ